MSDPISNLITGTWVFVVDLVKNLNRSLGLPESFDPIAISSAKTLLLFLLVSLDLLVIIWMERKILGRIHHRRSVTETGPAGFLQNIADFLKFLVKEDLIPDKADRFFHNLVPILYVALTFLPLVVIPFAPGLWVARINASLIAVLAILSLLPGLVIVGGWGGGSKFSLIGAFRAGLLLVAYEVPLSLSVISIALLGGSLDLVSIVEAQRNIWFILVAPIAAIVFLIAGTMELERSPFDISEAESELTVGWKTEFPGLKFALLYAGQYIQMFVFASMFTIMFLGGWYGPILHPLIWFLIKIHIVMMVMVWIRVTYFRPRPDQIVKIGYKWMIPLSVLNLFIVLLAIPFIQGLI